MNGKKVRLPFATTDKGAVLDVGTLPQGPFVLSVVTNEGIANVKLVKM